MMSYQKIDEIDSNPGAVVILAGDINTLSDTDIATRAGLAEIVSQPTQGPNKLDRIYVSDVATYHSVKIIQSTV